MESELAHIAAVREHLRDALDALGETPGEKEPSITGAAVRQAMGHLALAVRRLEQERPDRVGHDITRAAGEAFTASQQAWRGGQDFLNRRLEGSAPDIDAMRVDIERAIAAIEIACEEGKRSGS
jgi:hypothetical protein